MKAAIVESYLRTAARAVPLAQVEEAWNDNSKDRVVFIPN
jgi:hypothetical protein